MTDLEWTQYGDACAAHETVTIGGREYRPIDLTVTPADDDMLERIAEDEQYERQYRHDVWADETFG